LFDLKTLPFDKLQSYILLFIFSTELNELQLMQSEIF